MKETVGNVHSLAYVDALHFYYYYFLNNTFLALAFPHHVAFESKTSIVHAL